MSNQENYFAGPELPQEVTLFGDLMIIETEALKKNTDFVKKTFSDLLAVFSTN